MNFNEINVAGYERVIHVTDETTGLDAIVAIHNTNLGPALGGCRAMTYDSTEDHIADALALAKGMTYKNAIAGLSHGGGKSAINLKGDKWDADKIKAFGEALNVINKDEHIYTTGGDVGTGPKELEILASATPHTFWIGSTDSGQATAYGVYTAMRAAVDYIGRDINMSVVSITGNGKVGGRLADFLLRDGIVHMMSDVMPMPEDYLIAERRGWTSVGTSHRDGSVWAPCATGGALNDITVPGIRENSVVCGGANNQLAHEGIEEMLAKRDITYVPDYVANAGGVIILATRGHTRPELEFDSPDVMSQLERIHDTTKTILYRADCEGESTAFIADRMAEEIFNG